MKKEAFNRYTKAARIVNQSLEIDDDSPDRFKGVFLLEMFSMILGMDLDLLNRKVIEWGDREDKE